MEKQYIVQAELTVQVTEDEWRRQRKTLLVDGNTTVDTITAWAKLENVDPFSLMLLPADKINPQS